MAEKNSEKRISVREAAKECGRNTETVRRWIWAGKLPAEKLGNQLFIKKEDLVNYCRETAVKYDARYRPDVDDKLKRLKQRIRVRGRVDFSEEEIAGAIHREGEERMNEIERSLKTADVIREREAKLSFLEKATALRNEIHARTGRIFNAEEMIRQLREEREDEFE